MHRKSLIALTVLCLAAVPAAGSPSASTPNSFFPVAVWYNGGKARAPMLSPLTPASAQQWGNDLDQIKAVGFNTVKCWVDWSSAEPAPGVFNFKNLNLLMKLAGERGLRVIVQIYTDSAPNWVGQRYPDGRFVDRSGAVITSQSAPGYCIDNAGVRAEIVKFIKALAHDANRYPALYGWDVWSEPHVINWADFPYLKNPEFCFCPGSQARFRAWLEAKYKTLAALNAAWYRDYTSWSEVSPPRFPTILSYTDYLDWRAFIDDKLAGDLKTRVDAVRSEDHTHPVTSHAAAPALFTSPMDGYGEPDDWKMFENADFFGTSLYPKHSESVRPWPYWMLAAGLDFTRSAGLSSGKGFWIGELQAGQGTTGMRIAQPVTSHDEELWMWESVAHGAREIAVYAWYPMSSGFESNGYGLIHLDGTLTPRARAAGRVAQIIGQHAEALNAAEPAPAQVAILYDRLSYMVGGTQSNLSKLGNAERDSLMGAYRAFFEQHIPVDFVHPAAAGTDRLGRYKIVFMPYPVMLSSRVAHEVTQYIRQGGTVVAGARLAWNNARGYASPVIPGFGLDKVFGAREQMIRPDASPQLIIGPGSALNGLHPGEAVPAYAFEEDLQPLPGARVLARFPGGGAAITENAYGQGKAILIGSFPCLAYQRDHGAKTKRLLLALAHAAGVRPQLLVDGQGAEEVEVRRLVGAHDDFLFSFNHSDHAVQASISVEVPWVVKRAVNLANGSTLAVRTESGRAIVNENLPPHSIRVVSLEAN